MFKIICDSWKNEVIENDLTGYFSKTRLVSRFINNKLIEVLSIYLAFKAENGTEWKKILLLVSEWNLLTEIMNEDRIDRNYQ